MVFVFHSHIPYCRKSGMWPFGEEWLYEAMLGSYIPFLDVLRSMSYRDKPDQHESHGKAPLSVTIGVTPILLDQLDDDHMREGFIKWMQARIKRAEEDRKRFKSAGDKALEKLAALYCDEYRDVLRTFCNDYAGDIVSALAELERQGVVEIITSAATHGYLPLLKEDTSIRAQLAVGCESHEMRFGRPSRGIWLPECAYRPGLEEYLEVLGIEYFFVDRHAIEGGAPIGVSSAGEGRDVRVNDAIFREGNTGTTYKPYLVDQSNVACMGRNERVTTQVWSSWLGYPGDGLYREFHRKDDVTGLQYWRVTGREVDLGRKEVYDREKAVLRAKEHAAHFIGLVHELISDWNETTGEQGLIVAPYDTELFGHWWYEGVLWLAETLKGLADSPAVSVSTAGEFLDVHPPTESIKVPESSWGRGGRHGVWLNDETAWMWDMIHAAEARIKRLAALSPATEEDEDLLQLLKIQALREFLLLTSSDWPFLVTERQAQDYGAKRFREHAERFDRLMDYAEAILEEGKLEEAEDEIIGYLSHVSELDNPFPHLRFSVLHRQDREKPEQEEIPQE